MTQAIITGCGFFDSKCPWFDLYVLAQTKKKNPKVCFLPSASGDSEGLMHFFHQLYDRYPCETRVLSLKHPETNDFESYLLECDLIIGGPGNTRYALALWRGYGLDVILQQAFEQGIVLAGGSAGAVIWAEQCITDSIPGKLSVMNCLGLLPFSNCPHFSSQERQTAYREHLANGSIKPGYACEDNAGLHFIDGKLYRGISNRHYARSYEFDVRDGKVIKKRIPTMWLGMQEHQQEFIWNSPTFNYLASSCEQEGQ